MSKLHAARLVAMVAVFEVVSCLQYADEGMREADIKCLVQVLLAGRLERSGCVLGHAGPSPRC